ncbi:MAG: hypothetical protein ABSC94_19110 [Polyangiaceae bacterium]
MRVPGPANARERGRSVAGVAVLIAVGLVTAFLGGCGGNGQSEFGGADTSGASTNAQKFGSVGGTSLSSGGGDGGIPQITCTGGIGAVQCATTCAGGGDTTISGTVTDPAGTNPLYNVTVYVPDPQYPLPNLDAEPIACGCAGLYPTAILASAVTDANGHFTITGAPYGTLSLVVQTGKWRMEFDGVNIKSCEANQVDGLRLPRNTSEGSLPNIAISTGGADSLECLPLRIGVSASEYVSGSNAGGHIHIYQGYEGASFQGGSPESNAALWDQQSDLNSHDVVLLSCEGRETRGGNPGTAMTAAYQTSLMNYANAGGRVFASHYHYAWFNTGPFDTGADKLATWITGSQTIDDTQSFPSDVDSTLAGGAAFPEGAALGTWLGDVGALTNGQLPIWFARNNVSALVQPPSTEWIHLGPSVTAAPSATQYFSVDTPIGAGATGICGRIVYSDLHVSGGPNTNAPGVPADYAGATRGGGGTTVPSGCAMHALTPQEDALEFMLFDLSSCLVSVGSQPMAPPATPPK